MSEDGARAATTVIAGVAFAVSAFAASLAALRAVSTTRDPFSSSSSSSVKTEDGGRRAALVLIAHPDDESYFFAPTVQALKRANVETHLVCLSDGGEGGDGETRKKGTVARQGILDWRGCASWRRMIYGTGWIASGRRRR